MNEKLKNLLTAGGASLVGFAGLGAVPRASGGGWPRALSIAVAMPPEIIARLPGGPQAGYTREYRRVNELLDGLALAAEKWLIGRGWTALAVTRARAPYDKINDRTRLPHKTAARLAGLGWIGRNALLVTREFGCAQRLTTVLTNAPLTVSAQAAAAGCGRCRRCLEACPGRAVAGGDFQPGLTPREALVDTRRCQAALEARRAAAANAEEIYEGASCGLCLALCPWTRRYLAERRPRLVPACETAGNNDPPNYEP